jgi:hypothetical protein
MHLFVSVGQHFLDPLRQLTSCSLDRLCLTTDLAIGIFQSGQWSDFCLVRFQVAACASHLGSGVDYLLNHVLLQVFDIGG